LPRQAARLLAFMFAAADVCRVSQETLKAEGLGKNPTAVLRALVEAGLLSKQPGTARIPDTYCLLTPAEVP
jgi:hypothetical protein